MTSAHRFIALLHSCLNRSKHEMTWMYNKQVQYDGGHTLLTTRGKCPKFYIPKCFIKFQQTSYCMVDFNFLIQIKTTTCKCCKCGDLMKVIHLLIVQWFSKFFNESLAALVSLLSYYSPLVSFECRIWFAWFDIPKILPCVW